jgi:hypothetical protein
MSYVVVSRFDSSFNFNAANADASPGLGTKPLTLEWTGFGVSASSNGANALPI